MSSQSSICIIVSVGRAMLAQYLINNANIYDINSFAIGKGHVGLAPDPSQVYLDDLMQISGADLTAITTKTYSAPSMAEYYCEIPIAYISPDPITEFALYYKAGFPGDTSETGAVMLAYATFQGITKELGSSLSFTVRLQV